MSETGWTAQPACCELCGQRLPVTLAGLYPDKCRLTPTPRKVLDCLVAAQGLIVGFDGLGQAAGKSFADESGKNLLHVYISKVRKQLRTQGWTITSYSRRGYALERKAAVNEQKEQANA